MANIDSSNRTVTDHLRDNGFPARLTIDTAPGDHCVVTTIRNAERDQAWTRHYADELKVTLKGLPGHPHVRASAIRELITVIWDGV